MKRTILTLVMSLALLSTAMAAPSAVFQMRPDGGADLESSEIMQTDLPGLMFTMATAGQTITLSGSMSDASLEAESDISLSVSLDSNSLKADFTTSGEDIAYMVGMAGYFGLNLSAAESEGQLRLNASGFLDKSLMESLTGVDLDLLSNNTEDVRFALQDFLNAAFADAGSPALEFTIDRLNLSGIFIIHFDIEATIDNWAAFGARQAAAGMGDDPSFAAIAECVGMTPESMIASLLTPKTSFRVEASGAEDTIKVSFDSSVGQPDANPKLKSIDLDFTKSGSSMELSGSALFSNMRPLLSCLSKVTFPGDYELEDFRYTLQGKQDLTAVGSFSAGMSSLAKKSGDKWTVDIPADMTSDMEVTVNPPTGMAILSVTGGSQSGGSAVSAAGEDFSVTYGKKAAGLDMNLVLGGVIVLLLLFFLLRRRRKA